MFSEKLKKRRLELGMSQEELAERVGYKSRSSIAKLESGASDVTKNKLKLLAAALDMTIEDLITEQECEGHGESAVTGGSFAELNVNGQVSGIDEIITRRSHKTVVLIQAGGKSTRNRMNVPNQFVSVDDKPIIVYVLEAYEKHPLIDEIHVVCLYGWEKILQSYAEKYHITKLKHIVIGGNTIIDSVRLGFGVIKKELNDNDVVILQEATRPMINLELISKILAAYDRFGNSVFVRPMNDYVQVMMEQERATYVDRSALYSVESPEIYSVATIRYALERQKKEFADDGSCCAVLMYRLGEPLHYCESILNNVKIVRQEDIYIFKVLNQIIL